MCMIQNRLSDFHCVYTFIQIVHTEFIKVVCTCCCSAFKSFNRMSQEQTAAAVTVALISEKNKSRKKKRKVGMKSRYETVAWKRKKLWILWNSACRTAIRRLRKWLYENFEKIFQPTKDEINKENTKMREPILPITCNHNWLFINRGIIQELCLWVYFFYLTMNLSTFTFRAFVFSVFFIFLLFDFITSHRKFLKKKTNHLI